MPNNSYVVGTRDASNKYRAVRVEAPNATEARELAVNRSSLDGVEVLAVSCKQINSLGETFGEPWTSPEDEYQRRATEL